MITIVTIIIKLEVEIAYNSYYGEEALPIKNRLQTHKVTRKLDEDNVWRLEFFC